MKEQFPLEPNHLETELIPLDISSEVRAIIEGPEDPRGPGKGHYIDEYLDRPDIRNADLLKLVLPWYEGSYWPEWLKGWLTRGSFSGSRQKKEAAIICTRTQMESKANVFASGVEWINSKSEESKE